MTQIGNELPNTLLGSGIDTLFGLGAGDNLTGSQDGKGLMNGNQGEDTLRSRAPADTMYGGQGNDVLISSGGSLMFGDLGNDTLVGESTTSVLGGGLGGSDTMNGGDGADSLVAAPGGNSLLFGNAGNDTLVAKNRQDTLFGGQGDDCLDVGSFALLAYGDLGNDKIITTGSTGGATLFGGSSDAAKNAEDGNDTITSGGNNLVFGNGGDDVLSGSTGDTIRGGQGDDTITAAGAEVFGDLGDDVINVSGNSTVEGGAGADTLSATGSGNMLMDGGSDANAFVLGAGATNNLVDLGSGIGAQTVDATASGSGNTIDGAASGGNNTIDSAGGNYIILGSGQETVTATPTDTVVGAGPGDSIIGGPAQLEASGNIVGTPNPDVLVGGSGADTIEGLASADTLTGGAGADVFLFRGANLAAVGAGSFSNSSVSGTALFVNYQYGGTGAASLGTGLTFGTPAGAIPVVSGTFMTPTGAINGGTIQYAATATGTSLPQLLFASGGSIGFISGGTIQSDVRFTLEPVPPVGDELRLSFGTNTLGSFGIGTAASADPFAGAGYGYSTSGFDVITDFEDGTDKIAIQATMLGLSASAGGNVIGTASAATGAFQEGADLAYDKDTGILYFLPSKGAGLSTGVGTVSTVGSTPTFVSAVFGTVAATGAALQGTTGTVASFGPPTSGTGAFVQTYYTFAPTGSTVIAPLNGGAFDPAGAARLPVPFLQLLNGGSPVTATIDFNDVTLF